MGASGNDKVGRAFRLGSSQGVKPPIVGVDSHLLQTTWLDPLEKYRRTFWLPAPTPRMKEVTLFSGTCQGYEKLADFNVIDTLRITWHLGLVQADNEDVLSRQSL